MKYLKLFDTHSDYTDFINTEIDKPNVSYCLDAKDVHFNPIKLQGNITITFDVEDASNPIPLYLYLSQQSAPFELLGVNMFDKVVIDGTEVSVADLDTNHGEYQLSVGEHTVVYTPKDPTLVGIIGDEQTQTITKYGACFNGCYFIKDVVLPQTLTGIYTVGFEYTDITSITIPNSVTSIGNRAFYECSSLTNITIPSSVTSIDSEAFSGCSALTSVTCEPTTPPSLATDVFKDTSSSLRIYVACDSVVAYRAASGWDNYSSKIFSADENCENNTVINA